jgi:hypothetical protein
LLSQYGSHSSQDHQSQSSAPILSAPSLSNENSNFSPNSSQNINCPPQLSRQDILSRDARQSEQLPSQPINYLHIYGQSSYLEHSRSSMMSIHQAKLCGSALIRSQELSRVDFGSQLLAAMKQNFDISISKLETQKRHQFDFMVPIQLLSR